MGAGSFVHFEFLRSRLFFITHGSKSCLSLFNGPLWTDGDLHGYYYYSNTILDT